MSNKKIVVILLNWNNWRETRECLESLKKVTYDNFEVLVVDNGSVEEEKDKIRNFQFLIFNFQTKTIWNNENLGFAGGNTVGVKYALKHGADYVMLLNNDTVVAPDFLTHLVRVAESASDYGILGSRIYKYDLSRQAHRKAEEIVFDGGEVNKWLIKARHTFPSGTVPDGNKEVAYITGAAMLIKREVVEKIGFMREEYFLYYEDVDWCIRARKAGYKCVLVPASKIWHKVSATNKEGSPSYIYYHTRNALMLAKFNGNIFQKIAGYIAGAFILLKQIPKFIFVPKKRVWAKSMTKGVLDFYRGKYGKYENRN